MASDVDRAPTASGDPAEKGFLQDVAKYLPAQVVPALVGVVSIPVITSLFPPHEYGLLSIVLATVAIAVTLLGWIPTAIVRFLPAAERDGTLPRFFGTLQGLTGAFWPAYRLPYGRRIPPALPSRDDG